MQADYLPTEPQGKPTNTGVGSLTLLQQIFPTQPFRSDLNQIPYDYTVEVINRFKGLDLINRVPEELWTEVHNLVQEAVIETIPKKKKCKKAK